MWRTYIDEAGDRGRSAGSTRHFLVAAVVVRDADDAQVRAEHAATTAALGRHPSHALHFRKLTHPQKVKACQDVASSSVAMVTSTIVVKPALSGGLPSTGAAAYITRPDPLYLYAVRLLLERVSWYIRDNGGGSSVVTFAHLKRFKAAKLHEYRRALERSPTKIHWPAFAGHPFRVEQPKHVRLLQLADLAASAIFQGIEPNTYGNVELRYLTELRPKLYRRGSAPVTSYGLKVFPVSEGNAGGSLHHLRTL